MLRHNCSEDFPITGSGIRSFKRHCFCAVVLLVILTCAFVFAKTRAHATAPIKFDAGLLADGDIIFRRGISLESNVIMTLDGGAPYSHVGIIIKQGDEIKVIHVVTEEPKGSPNVTRVEPLAVFLASERASAAAVYRVRPSERQYVTEASQIASAYAAAQIPFDSDFDLSSSGALYCTELVWRAYKDAGLDLIDNEVDTINTPLGRGRYILPGRLLGSSHLQLIWSSN